MAHICDYYYTLQIENENELVLVAEARYLKRMDSQSYEYSLDVYKYNITTRKAYARDNLIYNRLGGYLVNFPNEKVKWYGEKYTVPKYSYHELFQRYAGIEYGILETPTEWIKERIIKCNPELKYLIKKIDFDAPRFNIWKLVNVMDFWKEHPSEVEALASRGFYNIATNKNLYRLSKPKKKAVIKALNNFNGHINDISLKEVMEFIKTGMSYQEWYSYMCWNNWVSKKDRDSIEDYRYCVRKNIDKYRYHDMLTMAYNQGHDINDAYWRYPNDPNAMHDRLLQVKQELERIAKEKELEVEKAYWNQLEKIAKRNKLKNGIDLGNGYTLFMPYEYEQYKKAADELHQCILASKYYKKVARGSSLLIMIWHDGKPSSTCEIDFNKKILQHYGNELDRSNCKPSEYEQQAIQDFLSSFKPKKLKFNELLQAAQLTNGGIHL